MIVKKFGEFLAIPRYGFLTTVLRMYLPKQAAGVIKHKTVKSWIHYFWTNFVYNFPHKLEYLRKFWAFRDKCYKKVICNRPFKKAPFGVA